MIRQQLKINCVFTMGFHGGRYTFINPATGASTSVEINDTTESKIAAAETAAASALGIAVSAMRLKCHHGSDPRRGSDNSHNK